MQSIQECLDALRLGTEEQENYDRIYDESMYDRARKDVRKLMQAATNYRVSILKTVNTFASMSTENLISAAQSMEVLYYEKGDNIITQDEIGDAFFICEEGNLIVSRRLNNTGEQRVLATLTNNSFFGEIALLTLEPRSATVSVSSEKAKILRMKKHKFEELTQQSKKIIAETQVIIGRDVVSMVPIFKNLTTSNKERLLEAMIPLQFLPNTYICRQGTVGNTFYIITEGKCHVTINSDSKDGTPEEVTVSHLYPGDFFGEIALIEKSSRRTANVISDENVSVMSLSRGDFEVLLKSLKIVMMEYQAMRGLNKNRGPQGNKAISTHVARRICGLNDAGYRSEGRVATLLRRFGKFMGESLWLSAYSKLYAEITLQHEKIFEYGSSIEKIVSMGYSRAEAMEVLSHEFERITATEIVKRNSADHGLVYAVLNQSSQLKDSFCADWQVYQFSELCKKIKFMRVKPLKKIIEVESRGTTFFLILRGSVRVFKAHPKGATSVESVVGLDKKRMLYVEDLSAGECFGEDVLSGLRTRMITVQAITAVELAVIDESDFTMVQEKSTFKMTVEDRYQFLSNVPLFKNWEPYNLYRIAHVLEHTELEKGTTIVKPGETSNQLVFLNHGRVDIVQSLHNKRTITTLQPFDYCGESGILNNRKTHGVTSKKTAAKEQKNGITEAFYALCVSRVDVLILPEDKYYYVDDPTAEIMKCSFESKMAWRNERAILVRIEQIKFKKYQKELLKRRSSSRKKLTSSASFNEDTERDMEDIPVILRQGYDPFMVFPTCRTTKEQDKFQEDLAVVRLPKSARLLRRSADSLKEIGFTGTTNTTSSIDAVTPEKGSRLDAQDRIEDLRNVVSPQAYGIADVTHRSNDGISPAALRAQRQSMTSFPPPVKTPNKESFTELFEKSSQTMSLQGSLRIPSAKSFRESCISNDELKKFASAYSPIDRPTTSSGILPKTSSDSRRSRYTN